MAGKVKAVKMKPELRWAIYGNCRLYVGQAVTRADIIAEHTHMLFGVSEFARGGRLSDEQREAWAKCQAKGDRCVRVLVTPAPKPRRKK